MRPVAATTYIVDVLPGSRMDCVLMQNKGGRTRGKQLYMGGYDQEVDAARTWDIAAIKWGLFPLNFDRGDYADQEDLIAAMSKDELITHLKRNSSGFSRGRSQYRGVTSEPCSALHRSDAAFLPTLNCEALLSCNRQKPLWAPKVGLKILFFKHAILYSDATLLPISVH